MDWYIGAFKKYAVFRGRARRKEYWFFVLFNTIFAYGFFVVDRFVGTYDDELAFGAMYGIYALVAMIPSISVAVRRLHDTNHSGWWLFILIVPIIGAIVILVFLVRDSTPGDNDFGPNPKTVPA